MADSVWRIKQLPQTVSTVLETSQVATIKLHISSRRVMQYQLDCCVQLY